MLLLQGKSAILMHVVGLVQTNGRASRAADHLLTSSTRTPALLKKGIALAVLTDTQGLYGAKRLKGVSAVEI